MQPNQLRNLQASGVWPEGVLHTGLAFVYTRRQDVEHLPDEHAEALFIVAMLDRLPEGWTIGPERDCWYVTRHDRLIGGEDVCKHPDMFLALYTALVSAGIVKEQA